MKSIEILLAVAVQLDFAAAIEWAGERFGGIAVAVSGLVVILLAIVGSVVWLKMHIPIGQR